MAASVRTFQTVGKEHTTVRKDRTPGGLSGRHTIAWGMLSRPKGVERETMAAKPELEAFSDALKQAREDSGMSRATAEAVEASHTVAQWERGEHARPPRVRMLEHVLQRSPRVTVAPVGVLACRHRRCTTPLASSRRLGPTRGWASATAGS